jgi:hypothetical protein
MLSELGTLNRDKLRLAVAKKIADLNLDAIRAIRAYSKPNSWRMRHFMKKRIEGLFSRPQVRAQDQLLLHHDCCYAELERTHCLKEGVPDLGAALAEFELRFDPQALRRGFDRGLSGERLFGIPEGQQSRSENRRRSLGELEAGIA